MRSAVARAPSAGLRERGAQRTGVRQDHGELLAAVARRHVHVLTQLRSQDRADGAQDAVTRGVPVGVVHALEVVEVEHDHREREAVARRAQRLGAQPLKEMAVVVQAGEAVGGRLTFDDLLLLLRLAVQLGVADRGRGLLAERGAQRRLLFGEPADMIRLADLEGAHHVLTDDERHHQRRHLLPVEELLAHDRVDVGIVETHLHGTPRADDDTVLRQVLDRVHRAERLLEAVGRVALIVRQPHHRVRLGIVLVDVARLRAQGARGLAADDVEDLVEVERRRHGARRVDERRELPVAGGHGT